MEEYEEVIANMKLVSQELHVYGVYKRGLSTEA